VTVAAESALRANTCSTAAIVLGDDAVPWLRAQNVPVRLVSGSGQIVVLNGWPQPSASARSAARTARRTN
jgi:thiamine biosynthesis lipoprotein